MSKQLTLIHRIFIVSLCVFSVGFLTLSGTPTHAQNPPPPPQKKKKLPPGSHGFEQFAGRDASDKLITGGGTRSVDMTDPATAAYAEAIQRGSDAYDSGHYDVAVTAFMDAIKAKPDQFRAYYGLGGAYEALNKFKEAADAYKHAIALKPDDKFEVSPDDLLLMTTYNLGNAYAAAGQHENAIAAYQQVLAKQPKLAQPHYNIGLSYVALNKSKEAIDAFKQAIALKPDFELAYYNLGVVYSKDEQTYPQAIEAFQKALSLDPNHAEAHYNLGLIYYMTDDQKGLKEQQQALQAMKPELAKELAKLIGK